MPKSKLHKLEKKPVWQKRFRSRIKPEVIRFTDSTRDDAHLIEYDIRCSLAHAEMLKRQGIISASEFAKIKIGLNKILKEHTKGKFKLLPEFEDVHMNVEFCLKKEVGSLAEKLHTARSRNDLIATELRLYCLDTIRESLRGIVELQKAILTQARTYRNIIIPGYTHLQQAQPMLVSFYLASYFYKFQRDFEQLAMLNKWINVSPLGSCAFAGTSIPIDRRFLATSLGFDTICENALDGVSDRDFLIDILYYISRLMLHISMLATDLIIFSTNEFKIVEFDDAVVTGSSIMPQKRNPDVCEILRAKSAKAIGNLMSALAIIKGITSSYNRDLQELKSILFGQIKECLDCLNILRVVLLNIKFKSNEDWQKTPSFICATDLVEFFVKKGYRFRNIYNLVAECIEKSNGKIHNFITLLSQKTNLSPETIAEKMKPETSIQVKNPEGSTGLRAVGVFLKNMSRCIARNIRRVRQAFYCPEKSTRLLRK
ncbi:MAG: argininosuccinate lyase [candidate division WOR-3 bacterium]